ncbi:hypothetical protein OROHE_014439 [Orobanche hederae]
MGIVMFFLVLRVSYRKERQILKEINGQKELRHLRQVIY